MGLQVCYPFFFQIWLNERLKLFLGFSLSYNVSCQDLIDKDKKYYVQNTYYILQVYYYKFKCHELNIKY